MKGLNPEALDYDKYRDPDDVGRAHRRFDPILTIPAFWPSKWPIKRDSEVVSAGRFGIEQPGFEEVKRSSHFVRILNLVTYADLIARFLQIDFAKVPVL
jgi:hypothetical protein